METFVSAATYIINLKSREDRKAHILKEFEGRNEFKINIVDACEHENGAIGLWNSITYILRNLVQEDADFIILGEDDHQFTEHYSKEYLFSCIQEAQKEGADILSGGISWFRDTVQVSKNLLWVQKFSGTQFMVIFKRFYKIILDAPFGNADNADYKISDLSKNKLFMYPFISTQKEFGYSDVTAKNNMEGRVEELFNKSSESLQHLKNVSLFYKAIQAETDNDGHENIILPTYIINLPERTDRLEHIQQQFLDKPEFDVTIVEACRHKIGAVGLWQTIRKVVQKAIETDDDVIIICEDDHEFTEDYFKDYLIKNIIETHLQGVDYLSGGPSAIGHTVRVTENRYWVSSCLATQFIILYKKLFQQILDEPFDDTVIADRLLSEMTVHKMILYPSVSVQKDFGYSDVTPVHNEQAGLVQMMFKETSERLEGVKQAYMKYNEKEPVEVHAE